MFKHRQSGVTLIEVLVTLFIMAIGLLGLAGLQSATIKDGLDTSKRSQITWLVSELIERMRANPDGLLVGYTNAATDCSAPAKQCSDNSAGDAATNCNANEMATFDVWEVFCGLTEDGVVANATDNLNLSAVSINCGAGACNQASNYTVSISWISQSVDDSRLLTDAAKAITNTQTISMVVRP